MILEVNKLYNLDCREGMAKMDAESVDCCISSPPYWSLRDYGIEGSIWGGDAGCEHDFEEKNVAFNKRNDKQEIEKTLIRAKEKGYDVGGWGASKRGAEALDRSAIPNSSFCVKCNAWKGSLGLEPNFELFITHLCDVYDEVKRVLKKTGTCWVNLGDTYSSSSTKSNWDTFADYRTDGGAGKRDIGGNIPKKRDMGGIPSKCLMMLPQRFAIEMINRGWILRNVIIWHKPNCMPSSARDRFTVDFEQVYLFVKAKKYWFDQDAVRVPQTGNAHPKGKKLNPPKEAFKEGIPGWSKSTPNVIVPGGKNRRTVWTIPTHANPEAHFATFPPKLVIPMIKAGCPRAVCSVCGTARERIVEREKDYNFIRSDTGKPRNKKLVDCNTKNDSLKDKSKGGFYFKEYYHIKNKTLGWSDCGCNEGWDKGLVLDPFSGSGTTLYQANLLKRDFIGFEMSKEYCKIADKKLRLTRIPRLDAY